LKKKYRDRKDIFRVLRKLVIKNDIHEKMIAKDEE